MGILEICLAISTIAGTISTIAGLFGKKKAQKRAKQVEAVAASVIKGVEQFSKTYSIRDGVPVKDIIHNKANTDGTEPDLNTLVKKYTN